jgi:BEN domain
MLQLELFGTQTGMANDRKLINFLLEAVFDRETLMMSTMTGLSRCHGTAKRLDDSKMNFIRELFLQHLKKDEKDIRKRLERFKRFNRQVTQKIKHLKSVKKNK